MKPIPLLFLSDNPALPTGLGRICKDLAVLASQLPEFRVGTMGLGGHMNSSLPFAQYIIPESNEVWGADMIESVWQDFAGASQGIIFTIWDVSRLHWFLQPMMGGSLQQFLQSKKFQRWGYIPVDHYGIGGRLTGIVKDALGGYDRLLAYSLFGKQVIEDTLGREVDWMPHGYNGDKFIPRGKAAGRAMLGISEDDTLIGCVMANQWRKDWGTAFGTISYLRKQMPNLKFWAHTDVSERYWSMPALAYDFGLADTAIITLSGGYTSEQLSYLYSACDMTILPSLGEGHGFTVTESLACGVPCITGDYGGAVEQIPDRNWLVEKSGERLDGLWNCVRPVWSPVAFADKIKAVLAECIDPTYCTQAIEHLRWSNLWPSTWKKWLLEGLK